MRGWKKKFLWIPLVLSLCLFGCSGGKTETVPKPTNASQETQQVKPTTQAVETETSKAETEQVEEETSTESVETQPESTETEEPAIEKPATETASELTVTFLDVGQGNAVLVQSAGHTMLIDGGTSERSSYVVSYLKQLGITELDCIVASHYDADHISGLVGVMNVFKIWNVMNPEGEADTDIYQSYIKMREKSGAQVIYPEAGARYSFGNVEIQVIYPKDAVFETENNRSLGIRIVNGENAFLILGDAEFESEYEILDEGWNLRADVYMASHHGSSSSSSERLLEAVDPDYVVISCGIDNTYGHPHKEIMERFEDHGYSMYRTDLQGTVTAVSDGHNITFDQEACTDFRSGDEESYSEDRVIGSPDGSETSEEQWIGNIHTQKLHRPNCRYLPKEANRVYFDSLEEGLEQGYVLGKCCN